jgi:hypothetical protein
MQQSPEPGNQKKRGEPMAKDDGMTTHDDDLVFSQGYSAFKVWFSVIVLGALPMWLMFYACYLNLLRGEYIDALILSAVPLAMLLFVLDAIFFKELLFYRDRVVKVWYLFGHRTIYYRAAKVIDPPPRFRWILTYHHIRETRPGKAFVLQIPILYIGSFFPSASAEVIARILDYLTEHSQDNPRIIKKAELAEGWSHVSRKGSIHKPSQDSYHG